MTKYKFRAKLENLIKEWHLGNSAEAKYRCEAYKELLEYIDSLQEEPVSNDLEAEFVLYLKHKFNISQEGNTLKTDGWKPSPYDILDIAKHFAQWQKEQIMKDAISMDVYYETEWDDIHKFLRKNLDGEKVKLLIIKDE